MNYYMLCITLLISTTWMLRVLDHQHYHSLTAQALVTQVTQEYLFKGIEVYVRAYYTQHEPPWQHKVVYQADKERVMVYLQCQEEGCITVSVQYSNKIYDRTIFV